MRVPDRTILLGLGALILIFDSVILTAWLPNTVLATADTPGYWRFAAMRTAGYPVLLHLFAALPGGLHTLVIAQFLAAGAAIMLLAGALLKIFRSAALAVALCTLLTVKQGIVALHFTLMTDALFFSCCTALLALAMLLAERPTRGRIVAITTVLVAANLLRPAVVGLLPPLAIVVLSVWQHRRSCGMCLAVALVASLAANDLVHPVVAKIVGRADAGAGAMSGFSLSETTAFLLTDQTPSHDPPLRDTLADQAAIEREALRAAPDDIHRYGVLLSGGDDFLFHHALREACPAAPVLCTKPVGVDASRVLRTLAIDAIVHDPAGMARLWLARLSVDLQFALTGDWLEWQAGAFDAARRAQNAAALKHDALPLEAYRTEPTEPLMAPDLLGLGGWALGHLALVNRLMLAAWIGSLCLFCWRWFRRRLDPETIAIGISAIGMASYHAMLAVSQTAFGRYTDAIAAWFLLTFGGLVLIGARHGLRLTTAYNRR